MEREKMRQRQRQTNRQIQRERVRKREGERRGGRTIVQKEEVRKLSLMKKNLFAKQTQVFSYRFMSIEFFSFLLFVFEMRSVYNRFIQSRL